MTRKRKPQQGIQSIEVGGRLLSALAAVRRPQMLRDLAREAGMPAAKAHRYLVSLGRMGLVEQNGETGLYDLGPFALHLGLSALGRLEPVSIAGEVLPELSQQTGQTVALAVWANHGPTIVRCFGADTPVSAGLRVGLVVPLTRSATGAAFAAFMPRQAVQTALSRELADNRRKGLAPTTREELDAFLEHTRRQGFAYTMDFIPGIGGMAAPVYDHSGAMALAFVALGYSKPFEADLPRIAPAMLRAAAAASERLGMMASDPNTTGQEP